MILFATVSNYIQNVWVMCLQKFINLLESIWEACILFDCLTYQSALSLSNRLRSFRKGHICSFYLIFLSMFKCQNGGNITYFDFEIWVAFCIGWNFLTIKLLTDGDKSMTRLIWSATTTKMAFSQPNTALKWCAFNYVNFSFEKSAAAGLLQPGFFQFFCVLKGFAQHPCKKIIELAFSPSTVFAFSILSLVFTWGCRWRAVSTCLDHLSMNAQFSEVSELKALLPATD